MNTTQIHRNKMTARLSSLLNGILNRATPGERSERWTETKTRHEVEHVPLAPERIMSRATCFTVQTNASAVIYTVEIV